MTAPRRLNADIFPDIRRQLDAVEFIQLIGSTTLFNQIPVESIPLLTLEELCTAARIVPLEKGESLLIESENPAKLTIYEILSGYVKIYDRPIPKSKKAKTEARNPPALLAWRVPGELLGDFQFTLPNKAPLDHIVATDDCQLLQLPARTIRNFAVNFPRVYLNIAANLTSKAIKARIRAQILRLPNMESMIAQLFIELLAERKPNQQPTGKLLVNGTFHIDDIAAFLGYEYRRTQAAVHQLIKDDYLKHYRSKKSGRFEICNFDGLHSLVERELEKARESD
jgi:CRP-like cAMP-binding protein